MNQASSLLKNALAIDPHLSPAYLQLGIVEAEQGKYAEAIRLYRRATESNPNSEEAHYRLSEAYKLTGDGRNARQELALYNRLSKQSADGAERERKQILQFVVALRNPSAAPLPK